MKKICLLLAIVMLVSSLAVYASGESGLQADPMALPTEAPSASFSLPEGYDPASEEDNSSYYSSSGMVYNDYGRAMYAGATPIPLDPIDMPTATPKPTLTFTYGIVTSDKLRLSFEAPVGWGIDASGDDQVVLVNPTAMDGINATITLRVYPVASSFKLADLRTELRSTLKELGQYNFSKWTTTELASRTLLKKDGYYADYEGTYYNGTAIYGRVMMALLDNSQVIMLHLSCPDGFFNNNYKAVINHVRETLKQQ